MVILKNETTNWAKPGGRYQPIVHVRKKHVELNSTAYGMVNLKFVDVGTTPDGLIVIRPGDSYTVSTYKTGKQCMRGRIGGTGLVNHLLDWGILLGDYKLIQDGGKWVAYPQDTDSKGKGRSRGRPGDVRRTNP